MKIEHLAIYTQDLDGLRIFFLNLILAQSRISFIKIKKRVLKEIGSLF